MREPTATQLKPYADLGTVADDGHVVVPRRDPRVSRLKHVCRLAFVDEDAKTEMQDRIVTATL
jgi:hypothetical protein